MYDPSVKRTNPQTVYGALVDPGSKVPKPDEIFLQPLDMMISLREIAPRLNATGAWWALGGRAGENLLDVHVNPTRVVILTGDGGMEKLFPALAEFNPPKPQELLETLKRGAEVDEKSYPVLAKSIHTSFTVKGVNVSVYSDYQLKVGDWDWGDPFVFEPTYVSIVGVEVPVMPLRLRSEIYITLGWLDRAKLVTDATLRAHHFLSEIGPGNYQPGGG